MSRPTQVLQIEPPNELVFKGPFTDVVTSYLKLINPSDKQVCFKVKTTAPKQYCVRPNSGFIAAKSSVAVAVMLQPFDYNAEEKNKHKFMVQTAFVPEGETSMDVIWKNTPAGDLMDSKLRVGFELPESQMLAEKSKSPATAPKTTNNVEADLRKAMDDNKRLQNHLHLVEQENSQLKEKLLREQASHPIGALSQANSAPAGTSWLAICIAALIAFVAGLLLSKFT